MNEEIARVLVIKEAIGRPETKPIEFDRKIVQYQNGIAMEF